MAGILAESVSKRFTLRKDRPDSVGQLLARMIPNPRRRRIPREDLWALRDVSFEMRSGESLGIVGNNGSGKSTLLKLLSRTMLPTSGRIEVRGKTSALIEIGAGFHPDFTGRENVFINASILGIRRREIERRLDAIVEFAELQAFIDVPVKYYSTGMQARLGFAVAIHVDPEILIVDEVLAVGDEAFQQKCMDRIYAMKRQGTNILLVSHSLGSVEQLMSKALWLNQGVIGAQGEPADVVKAYRAFMGEGGTHVESVAVPPSTGQDVVVSEIRILTAARQATDTVATGDTVVLEVECENRLPALTAGYLEVKIRRGDGLEIAHVSGLEEGHHVTFPPGKSVIRLEIEELYLVTGIYDVDLMLLDANGRRKFIVEPAARLNVQSLRPSTGVIALPHRWL